MKFKKIILSVSVLFTALIISLSFFNKDVTAEQLMKLSKEERLANSKKYIEEMSENPSDENVAMISFDELKDGKKIKEFLENKDLKIEKVFNAFKGDYQTFTGAYVDCDNKSIDEIIDTYEKELDSIINSTINDTNEQIEKLELSLSENNSNTDKDKELINMIDSLKKLKSDSEKQAMYFNSYGLGAYGIKVKGKNSELLKLSKDKNVKAVELLKIEDTSKITPILSIE